MSNVDPNNIFPQIDSDALEAFLEKKFGSKSDITSQVNPDDVDHTPDDDDDVVIEPGPGGEPDKQDDVTSDQLDPDKGADANPHQEHAPDPEIEVVPDPDEGADRPRPEARPDSFTISIPQPDGDPVEVVIPRDTVAAYYAFEQRLRTDPDLAAYISAYNSSPTPAGSVQTPVTEQSQPPPDLDLDDPNIKFLYDQWQKQTQELEALKSAASRHEQVITQQSTSQVEAIINTAVSSFKSKHNLNDDEITRIREIAGRSGVVNSYMSGLDPITGMPVVPDPLMAIDKALDMAYWSVPEYRNRLLETNQEQDRKDRVRKQKASALSGNSGSVPRTAPVPKTDAERRKAMVAEVAAEMFGANG